MGNRRQWGRALAARSDKGTVVGDLDLAEVEVRAAAEAYGVAYRRFQELTGGEGMANDPRAPWAEWGRLRKATMELQRLLRLYMKIARKRALGDRTRSKESALWRLRRLRDTLEPAMLAIEPFLSMDPQGLGDLKDMRDKLTEGIEVIENRGLPRKRP